ncbi:unnamed protein product [Cuscuta campestris]|uniref:14-3-3 domain-containing protein n=1 Tax=Cuscuta campestris TaxID=132261 RepID=A0A484LPG6_9ASTE|nr:unnamed protein product [Cuscuta campestris]
MYDEVVEFMVKVLSSLSESEELSVEERNLLSIAYKTSSALAGLTDGLSPASASVFPSAYLSINLSKSGFITVDSY